MDEPSTSKAKKPSKRQSRTEKESTIIKGIQDTEPALIESEEKTVMREASDCKINKPSTSGTIQYVKRKSITSKTHSTSDKQSQVTGPVSIELESKIRKNDYNTNGPTTSSLKKINLRSNKIQISLDKQHKIVETEIVSKASKEKEVHLKSASSKSPRIESIINKESSVIYEKESDKAAGDIHIKVDSDKGNITDEIVLKEVINLDSDNLNDVKNTAKPALMKCFYNTYMECDDEMCYMIKKFAAIFTPEPPVKTINIFYYNPQWPQFVVATLFVYIVLIFITFLLTYIFSFDKEVNKNYASNPLYFALVPLFFLVPLHLVMTYWSRAKHKLLTLLGLVFAVCLMSFLCAVLIAAFQFKFIFALFQILVLIAVFIAILAKNNYDLENPRVMFIIIVYIAVVTIIIRALNRGVKLLPLSLCVFIFGSSFLFVLRAILAGNPTMLVNEYMWAAYFLYMALPHVPFTIANMRPDINYDDDDDYYY